MPTALLISELLVCLFTFRYFLWWYMYQIVLFKSFTWSCKIRRLVLKPLMFNRHTIHLRINTNCCEYVQYFPNKFIQSFALLKCNILVFTTLEKMSNGPRGLLVHQKAKSHLCETVCLDHQSPVKYGMTKLKFQLNVTDSNWKKSKIQWWEEYCSFSASPLNIAVH